MLFDTGLRRGLLSELGTPKQGGWLEGSPVPQHKTKPVSSVVPWWPPAGECDVGTMDILTLEVHGARQQCMQDSAASRFLHACDGVAKAGSLKCLKSCLLSRLQ